MLPHNADSACATTLQIIHDSFLDEQIDIGNLQVISARPSWPYSSFGSMAFV